MKKSVQRDPEVVLDFLGALFLDDGAAGLEVVVVGVVVLLHRLEDGHGLDLGLGGVVDAAGEVAVSGSGSKKDIRCS